MVVDRSEVHRFVEQRLKSAELVYTKGRRDLVELLADSSRPVTVAELQELRPRLTLSSLYRNLTDLESVGVVQKVQGTDDRWRFELSEDLSGHHHHSICTSCGRIDDFVVPARTERTIEQALARILDQSGFRPASHRLDVVGLCATCSDSPATRS